jgi:hypothetical protein
MAGRIRFRAVSSRTISNSGETLKANSINGERYAHKCRPPSRTCEIVPSGPAPGSLSRVTMPVCWNRHRTRTFSKPVRPPFWEQRPREASKWVRPNGAIQPERRATHWSHNAQSIVLTNPSATADIPTLPSRAFQRTVPAAATDRLGTS